MKALLLVIIAIMPIALSRPARALVFVQGAMGSRGAALHGDNAAANLQGYAIEGAIYVDPVPLWPLAFGGTLAWSRLMATADLGEVVGYELSLEALAWYSFAVQRYNLSPYLKVGQVGFGAYRISKANARERTEPTGSRLALGLRFELLFRLAVFVEAEWDQSRYRGARSSYRGEGQKVLVGWASGL